MYDAVILGAGAAGLMCAVTAGRRGFRCVLLDHGPVAGRKIRIAGGGKGNVTNLCITSGRYVSEHPRFPESVLRRCPPSVVLDMLADFGIPWEEREHGRIFCTVPAARLVDALSHQIAATGSELLTGRAIGDVEHADGHFNVRTSHGSVSAPRLIIATGSPAWPDAGATDGGMRLARRFGHRIVPPRPVLTPFVLPAAWPLHGLAGISLPTRVHTEGMPPLETDALLFTHKGMSGPALLQASCFWRPGRALTIDFLPGTSVRDILADPANGKASAAGLLKKRLPARLAERLLRQAPEGAAGRKAAELDKTERTALARLVHRHEVLPCRTLGMARAEAAAGGVDTRDVNPKNLESRLVPGLFLAGEVLDVTGLLGGYNLHWAWACGKTVGEAFRTP